MSHKSLLTTSSLVSIEKAYELSEELDSPTKQTIGAMTVFTGLHSERGSIHIVIPPLGDAAILPFVIQNSAS